MESGNNESVGDCSEDHHRKGISAIGSRRNSIDIVARPNASPGYWLCMLLPLAQASNIIEINKCKEQVSTQLILTIAAFGMCIDNLCFFLYMFCKAGFLFKLMFAFLPGLVATSLFNSILQQSWSYGLFLGYVITFCYQNTYIRIMRALPGCFSFGEAAVLVQGLILFVLNTLLKLFDTTSPQIRNDFDKLNVIMMCGLLCLFVASLLLAVTNIFRKTIYFYPLLLSLTIGVTCTPITKPIPCITLLKFIIKDVVRVKIMVFYLTLSVLTILIVLWQTRKQGKASTRVRKLFHILIVLVYVPGLLYQCDFLYIASGVTFAVMTVFEIIRICNIPPLAGYLCRAFASFSDQKDGGMLALTPFCLLIGCSLPVWISPCPCGISDSFSVGTNIVPLMSGILTIGVGDTAASVIGSMFGRTMWHNSNKSLEGTLAFVLMTLLSLMCLDYFGFISLFPLKWFLTAVATIVTALIEAHTDQIDNLTLPIIFYTIVNIS